MIQNNISLEPTMEFSLKMDLSEIKTWNYNEIRIFELFEGLKQHLTLISSENEICDLFYQKFSKDLLTIYFYEKIQLLYIISNDFSLVIPILNNNFNIKFIESLQKLILLFKVINIDNNSIPFFKNFNLKFNY